MAREHHCPNCGPQACNASTSKIHTCGVCAAIWEEDLSAPAPAPATSPPRPASPAPVAAPVAAPKPATPAPALAPPTSAPPTTPAAAKLPSTPSPGAVPTPAAPAAPPAPSAPVAKPAPPPISPVGKTLIEALQGAKVKRCPRCTSDSLAAPSDLVVVQSRVAFVDSQTYRGHWWYGDTGEAYVPPTAVSAAAPPSTPKPVSAPRPSS